MVGQPGALVPIRDANLELAVRTLLELGIFLIVTARRYNDLRLRPSDVRWALLGHDVFTLPVYGAQALAVAR